MTDGLRPGVCMTALCCALLWCMGCDPAARSIRDDRESSSTRRQEQTLWSPTLHWNGIRFRFELVPGADPVSPRYLYRNNRDILQLGRCEVSLVRTRFKIGETFFDWSPDSIIWIYLPPHRDRPFFRRVGSLQLTWVGDGNSTVVEEQRRDGSHVWTHETARVTRRADGTVDYQGPGPDLRRHGRWELIIGPAGRIVEEQR